MLTGGATRRPHDLRIQGRSGLHAGTVDVLKKWAAGDATIPDSDFRQLGVLAEAIASQKFGFREGSTPSRQDPLTNQAIGKFADWARTQKP